MLEQVISGGQTGADMAGLQAAAAVGLRTGGWMPRGFKTENGPRPDLAERYGLKEARTDKYPERTRLNVYWANATVIVYRGELDGGSELTAKYCQQVEKPFLLISGDLNVTMMGATAHWLLAHRVTVLNVAGNRESRAPGLQAEAAEWLEQVFRAVKKGGPI